MKRLSFIVLFFVAFSFQAQAQKINFSLDFKPNAVYTNTSEQSTQLKLESPQADLSGILKEQGIEGPISTKTEIVTRAGNHTADKKLPLVMTITKSENNIHKDVLPVGTRVYAHFDQQKLTIDSIGDEQTRDRSADDILKAARNMMSNLEIPDTTLKVGDSILVSNTIPLPIPSFDIKMAITSRYRLVSVDGNIARFDVVESYSSSKEEPNSLLEMTGSGKGVLFYDIANHLYKEYKMDSEAKVRMKFGDQELSITTLATLNQSTTISR